MFSFGSHNITALRTMRSLYCVCVLELYWLLSSTLLDYSRTVIQNDVFVRFAPTHHRVRNGSSISLDPLRRTYNNSSTQSWSLSLSLSWPWWPGLLPPSPQDQVALHLQQSFTKSCPSLHPRMSWAKRPTELPTSPSWRIYDGLATAKLLTEFAILTDIMRNMPVSCPIIQASWNSRNRYKLTHINSYHSTIYYSE